MLQSTIDSAVPGDTILLDAGATFMGPITLDAKPNRSNLWITIQTTGWVSSATRVGPNNAASMANVCAPYFYPAIQTQATASDYLLRGLNIFPVDATANFDTLVTIGDATSNQSNARQQPTNILIDQCYIHAFDSTQTIKRGVALNDGGTAGNNGVTNSYISGFKSTGQDTQAIAGWNGTGPYVIQNNYLEASGENVIFGGGFSYIGKVPSNITITDNLFSKPLSWDPFDPNYAHIQWSVKNLLELKNADTVTVANNTFQNNWVQSQTGNAILLTPRGAQSGGSWVTVSNVTIAHNTISGVAQGIEILGSDDMSTTKVTSNITIQNNLFGDVASGNPKWGASSPPRVFSLDSGQKGGPNTVIIDHNTILQNNGDLVFLGGTVSGFQFTNNIAPHGEYGVVGNGQLGKAALDALCPKYVFTNNVIVFSSDANVTYPSGTFEVPANNWSSVFGGGYAQNLYDDPGTYVAIGSYTGLGSSIASFSTMLF
jgi:hypothetical protein